MNAVLASPSPLITDWLHSASAIRPQWLARRQLRQSLLADPDLQAAIDESGGEKLQKFVRLLFTHPYWSFEPRPNKPGLGDEQQQFIESQAITTVCLGGNSSGKTYCGAQRAIKFMCEDQPPPIKDTPFFVIAENLEESGRSCWSQKLYNMLPSEWVDWDRIVWQKSKLNFPRVVPLRPWTDNPKTNWTMYFCAYGQERAAFQSVAAGGAWFTEQCDWEIYEEVLMRMREWMFPGSVWMEFTPIDPSKTHDVQEKYEAWCRGQVDHHEWMFCRLNSEECAKAGHIPMQFIKTLKANVSKEMIATRLYGLFASYEGAIYQTFNPQIHLVEHVQFDPNMIHKRSLDWGAGLDNALCIHWFQKDSLGRYYFYDEYYTTDQTKTWEDHCREIHKKDGWNLIAQVHEGRTMYLREPLNGKPPRWRYGVSNFGQTYAPPDSPDLFREFAKYRIPISSAKCGPNSYLVGIDCVRRLLKYDEESLAQGTEPKIFIDKNRCPFLAWQLPALRWQKPPKNAVNPKAAKMIQVKKDDHAADSLRYGLFSDWSESQTAAPQGFYRSPPARPQVRHQRLRA